MLFAEGKAGSGEASLGLGIYIRNRLLAPWPIARRQNGLYPEVNARVVESVRLHTFRDRPSFVRGMSQECVDHFLQRPRIRDARGQGPACRAARSPILYNVHPSVSTPPQTCECMAAEHAESASVKTNDRQPRAKAETPHAASQHPA